MDLNKEVIEILDWHYGGSHEKKRLVAQLIIQKVKEQENIDVVVFNKSNFLDGLEPDNLPDPYCKENIINDLCSYRTCHEKAFMYGLCKHHLAQQDL